MNNNADPSRFREIINRSVVIASLLVGSIAVTSCTAESAPQPTVQDSYNGSEAELIATPITGGPVGNEKDSASLITIDVSTNTIDETTLSTIKTARQSLKSLKNSAVKFYANLDIDARAAEAIISDVYPSSSNDTTSAADSIKLFAQETAVVKGMTDPDVKKAAAGVLDYELANAVLIEDGTSPDGKAQQKVLLGLIKDPVVKKNTQDALDSIAVSGVNLNSLSLDITSAESNGSSWYSVASDSLYDGSSEQAAKINDAISVYHKNLTTHKSSTWLKDVGLSIVKSVTDKDKYILRSVETIKTAQTRARQIPDAAVQSETLQSIDNTIAAGVQFESTTEVIAMNNETFAQDDAYAALISNLGERQQVDTMLNFIRGEALINETDKDVAAALVTSISNPVIKSKAQAAHGGTQSAAFKNGSDASKSILYDEMVNPAIKLYYGSNTQANDINKLFTKFNDAVTATGR